MQNIIKEYKLIAVYARVSTSAQETQETIEAQLLQVRNFAEEHGYTIVKEYLDNGWSGDILARPGLDELRVDARKHIWEAVLIYDPDRLGRQLFYQQIVIDELKQLEIEILFVTMPPIKNASDELMFGVRGLFAAYEKAKIAERFRIGKVSRVTNNQILLSEAPYGYTYIPNIGKKGTGEYHAGHIIINESEAVNVRNMFKWVADEGLTLRAVVKRLQDLGVSPRKSKRNVWNTSTLSTLLKNQTYIGNAHWGASYAVVPEKPLKDRKYKKIKKTSRRMHSVDKWLTIKVPRLIEDEIFIRAGQKMRDNFAVMGRNKKNDYLLAGKIWCTCGRRRAGEGPQRGKHLYYRCTDRVYSFPLPRNCNERGINARIADVAIWERLNKILSNPELMRVEVEKCLNNYKSTNVNKYVIDIEGTKQEIAKLKGRQDKYTNAYSENVISLEKLKEFITPLKDNVSSLEKNLAQAYVEQKSKQEIVVPSDEEIELFASEAKEHLKSLSFEQKKGIIRNAVTKIQSTQSDLHVHGILNYSELYVIFFTEYRYRWSS